MNSKRAKLHLGQTLMQLVSLFWILSVKLLCALTNGLWMNINLRPFRINCISNLDGLSPSPSFSKPFHSSSLKYKDFLTLLAMRRNASSPGLNSIPYKVYKKCPLINTFLFNVFKSCLKTGGRAEHWVPIKCI